MSIGFNQLWKNKIGHFIFLQGWCQFKFKAEKKKNSNSIIEKKKVIYLNDFATNWNVKDIY